MSSAEVQATAPDLTRLASDARVRVDSLVRSPRARWSDVARRTQRLEEDILAQAAPSLPRRPAPRGWQVLASVVAAWSPAPATKRLRRRRRPQPVLGRVDIDLTLNGRRGRAIRDPEADDVRRPQPRPCRAGQPRDA